MRGARQLVPLLLLAIVALVACTKTVRVVPPVDYATALADTTRMFQINTHDGSQYVSKKASVEGDSVLVVMKGHQVQEDPWRQKKMAKVPIRVPLANIEQISQEEIDHDQNLVIVLVGLGVLFGLALTVGWATGLSGP